MKKAYFFLKRTIAGIILALITIPVSAQVDTVRNLPNLLFPKFSWGIIKLKTGEMNKAMLNYNTVTQELVFMQKDVYLVLENPQTIDTVILWNKIFIPFDKAFYELAVTAPISLFIRHKSYVEQPGVQTGFGAKSQTAGPTSVARYYGSRGPIDLKIPDDYRVFDDSDYWVRRNGKMENFKTKRQFLNIFSDKKSPLTQFINQNMIDFANFEHVKKLIDYCNELYI